MKKIISVFLALIFVLALASCGDSKNETSTQAPSAATTPETEKGTPSVPSSFEEVTVVDNDKCVIRITGISYDDFFGYTFNVYLENRSADKTYSFSTVSGYVNGVLFDPSLYQDVAPGKKANERMTFSDERKLALVGTFTDVEIEFRVSDANDLFADDIVREKVNIYPMGKDKATVYTREPANTDITLVDNELMSAVITGFEKDDFWGYVAKVYVINKSSESLSLTTEDVSVNGFMCDPFFGTTLDAGKKDVTTMTWSIEDFEKNGIKQIEEIEMKLRIYRPNDFFSDDLYSERITVKP